MYAAKHGDALLTGDSAMNITASQAKAGLERIVRPPIETSVDDAELREQRHPLFGKMHLRSVPLCQFLRPLSLETGFYPTFFSHFLRYMVSFDTGMLLFGCILRAD